MKKDTTIRALFIGDVRFDSCPMFELNTKTMYFEMISDPECAYSTDIILDDPDFILFIIVGDHAKKLPKTAFRRIRKEL